MINMLAQENGGRVKTDEGNRYDEYDYCAKISRENRSGVISECCDTAIYLIDPAVSHPLEQASCHKEDERELNDDGNNKKKNKSGPLKNSGTWKSAECKTYDYTSAQE
jgi:hypothetical protein